MLRSVSAIISGFLRDTELGSSSSRSRSTYYALNRVPRFRQRLPFRDDTDSPQMQHRQPPRADNQVHALKYPARNNDLALFVPGVDVWGPKSRHQS